jgi:hypothetical protein
MKMFWPEGIRKRPRRPVRDLPRGHVHARNLIRAGWRLPPSPIRCFLEVLILNDFKSFEPEVLILMDFKSFFSEVLILDGLKSLIMSTLEEFAFFLEVLIPGSLRPKTTRNGAISEVAGATLRMRFTLQHSIGNAYASIHI